MTKDAKIDTPRPPSHGGVVSLDKRRIDAAVTGDDVYCVAYAKGEAIAYDTDEDVAFVVRSGRVAVQRDIQTPGGVKCVDVSVIEQGESFCDGRLIGFLLEEELQNRYVALTNVEIVRLPRSVYAKRANDPQFLKMLLRSKIAHDAKMRSLVEYLLQKLHEKAHANGLPDRKRDVALYFLYRDAERKLRKAAERTTGLEAGVMERDAAIEQRGRKITELRKANQDLRASHAAVRESLEAELEHVAAQSQAQYAELEGLRRESAERWKAIEEVLKRYGIDKLAPDELERLLGMVPAPEREEIMTVDEADLEEIYDEPHVDAVEDGVDEALQFVQEPEKPTPYRRRFDTVDYGDAYVPRTVEPFRPNESSAPPSVQDTHAPVPQPLGNIAPSPRQRPMVVVRQHTVPIVETPDGLYRTRPMPAVVYPPKRK